MEGAVFFYPIACIPAFPLRNRRDDAEIGQRRQYRRQIPASLSDGSGGCWLPIFPIEGVAASEAWLGDSRPRVHADCAVSRCRHANYGGTVERGRQLAQF